MLDEEQTWLRWENIDCWRKKKTLLRVAKDTRWKLSVKKKKKKKGEMEKKTVGLRQKGSPKSVTYIIVNIG